MNYSTNEKAAAIVGFRKRGIAINMPCEEGFHCPVCEYPDFKSDGEYDERLQWSEYNAFLWCEVCTIDYPSVLCMPNTDRAIDIFLHSVEDAIKINNSMAVNCPTCGVAITTANEGGYRTYCEKCAEDAVNDEAQS